MQIPPIGTEQAHAKVTQSQIFEIYRMVRTQHRNLHVKDRPPRSETRSAGDSESPETSSLVPHTAS